MGTTSAFARSVWAPRVSGFLAGRGGRFGALSATTSFVNSFCQLPGTSTDILSLNISRFYRVMAQCDDSNDQSHWGLGNGSEVGVGVYPTQVRFLTSNAKTGTQVANKGSMKKKKRSSGPAESNGLGLLADDVEDPAAALQVDEPYLEKCGSLHLILGPMFAGKSTALLKRAQEELSAGRRVALVKSDKDSRYSLSAVVTHDGVEMPCYAVPDLASFKAHVGDKLYKEFDVIGIDEAQFFTDLYDFCLTAADYEGKTVIAAGLDGDFLRRKFGSTVDLVKVADSVVKLSSRCEICGRPAIFTFRKTLDIQTEIIGGADMYMPVCRQHYVSGQMVVDSACTVLEAHQVAHSRNDVCTFQFSVGDLFSRVVEGILAGFNGGLSSRVGNISRAHQR